MLIPFAILVVTMLDWKALEDKEAGLMAALMELPHAPTSELYRFIAHPNTLVGSTAAAELVRRQVPDAYEKLSELAVTHPVNVTGALRELGDPRAAVPLARALPFASGMAWGDILDALVELNSPDAVPALIDAASESPDARVVHIFNSIIELNGVPSLSERWSNIPSEVKKAYLEHVWLEAGDVRYVAPLVVLFENDPDDAIRTQGDELRAGVEAAEADKP